VEVESRQEADLVTIQKLEAMVMSALAHMSKPDHAMKIAAQFVNFVWMVKPFSMHSMLQSTQLNARPVFAGQMVKSNVIQIIQLMEVGLNGDNGVNVTRLVVEANDLGQGIVTAQNPNVVEIPALEIAMRSIPATTKSAKNVVPMNSSTQSPSASPLASPSAQISMTAQHVLWRTVADVPQVSTEGMESVSAWISASSATSKMELSHPLPGMTVMTTVCTMNVSKEPLSQLICATNASAQMGSTRTWILMNAVTA
jgi:hypothetical protein